MHSGVDSGGAGGARAPPEFGDSEKGRNLISAYQSLAITSSTSGFEKLSMAMMRTCSTDQRFIRKRITTLKNPYFRHPGGTYMHELSITY